MFLWRELLGLGTRFYVNNEAKTFSGRGSRDFSDLERVDVLHAGLKEPWEGGGSFSAGPAEKLTR